MLGKSNPAGSINREDRWRAVDKEDEDAIKQLDFSF
jgi:hypothetical protein